MRDADAVCAQREKALAAKYESTISTWSAVEAIVREKDIEAFRAGTLRFAASRVEPIKEL